MHAVHEISMQYMEKLLLGKVDFLLWYIFFVLISAFTKVRQISKSTSSN